MRVSHPVVPVSDVAAVEADHDTALRERQPGLLCLAAVNIARSLVTQLGTVPCLAVRASDLRCCR